MNQQLTPELARYLFSNYGGWFGLPALVHHGALIDGRIRAEQRGRIALVAKQVFSNGEAIKFLCLAGHHERAKQMYREPIESFRNSAELAAYCHCTRDLVAPLYCKHDGRHRRTTRALNTIKRRDAITRMGQLLRECEETNGTVTAEQLREALGPWL